MVAHVNCIPLGRVLVTRKRVFFKELFCCRISPSAGTRSFFFRFKRSFWCFSFICISMSPHLYGLFCLIHLQNRVFNLQDFYLNLMLTLASQSKIYLSSRTGITLFLVSNTCRKSVRKKKKKKKPNKTKQNNNQRTKKFSI